MKTIGLLFSAVIFWAAVVVLASDAPIFVLAIAVAAVWGSLKLGECCLTEEQKSEHV